MRFDEAFDLVATAIFKTTTPVATVVIAGVKITECVSPIKYRIEPLYLLILLRIKGRAKLTVRIKQIFNRLVQVGL